MRKKYLAFANAICRFVIGGAPAVRWSLVTCFWAWIIPWGAVGLLLTIFTPTAEDAHRFFSVSQAEWTVSLETIRAGFYLLAAIVFLTRLAVAERFHGLIDRAFSWCWNHTSVPLRIGITVSAITSFACLLMVAPRQPPPRVPLEPIMHRVLNYAELDLDTGEVVCGRAAIEKKSPGFFAVHFEEMTR